jgi:hypothetical protein
MYAIQAPNVRVAIAASAKELSNDILIEDILAAPSGEGRPPPFPQGL